MAFSSSRVSSWYMPFKGIIGNHFYPGLPQEFQNLGQILLLQPLPPYCNTGLPGEVSSSWVQSLTTFLAKEVLDHPDHPVHNGIIHTHLSAHRILPAKSIHHHLVHHNGYTPVRLHPVGIKYPSIQHGQSHGLQIPGSHIHHIHLQFLVLILNGPSVPAKSDMLLGSCCLDNLWMLDNGFIVGG